MPLEKGGRADKIGNRYEINCIILELLKLVNEKNHSVTIEALGDDEKGTDILVNRSDGTIEHQQCKVRNIGRECWSVSDLERREILENWRFQLERSENRYVALISPVGCNTIMDMRIRAYNTNGNPKDFYVYQIKKSDKKFVTDYDKFCEGMGLDPKKQEDVVKSIDYLKRIRVNQISENILEDCIFRDIEWHFISDKNTVYNALYEYVANEDIYGVEITFLSLKEFLKNQNLIFRLRDGDERIIPQIEKLNLEYRSGFISLKDGLLYRKEFDACIEYIRQQHSFIISGSAGSGKSGCTEAILNFCEKEHIPHLAIKLDRKMPGRSCELWGNELGFQGSFSYALDMISRNQTCVIILDQLDALRWTQANSIAALYTCMELIRQVNHINCERSKKMVIVFVCREYDLNNDTNISSLFQNDSEEKQKMEWKKVHVGNFDDVVVRQTVGEEYEILTLRTRKLLRVPANLYIWQQLGEKEKNTDCATTSNLIEEWYRQIRRKSARVGVEERTVINTLETIVEKLEQSGRLYIPEKVLSVEDNGLDYLIAVGMVSSNNKKIGFVHQSILDYFIAKRMMKKYMAGEPMDIVIGEKNGQTPGKRYQVQMVLQNLLEFDSSEFLKAGDQMLASHRIRFYVKYIFFDLLRQIEAPDEETLAYLAEKWKDDSTWDYFLNDVLMGNCSYIRLYRDQGILDDWFSDKKRKLAVFQLLESISFYLDKEDVELIQRHAFKNEDDDKMFSRCLLQEISQDTDEFFELRMAFYEQYPEWSQGLYMDVKKVLERDETRYIRLIAFWLRHQIISEGRRVYYYEEELLECEDGVKIQNGMYVLEQLLPYIPQESGWKIRYSDWSNHGYLQNGLERAVIEIVKKANRVIIAAEPERFWNIYLPYMGKGYCIFNEILLYSFQHLPDSYSDQIIQYLGSNLEKNAFDYTSGEKDQLAYVKKILEIHRDSCSENTLENFAETLACFQSPRAIERYQYRIDKNREKNCEPVYWSFWGELQYELLSYLPLDRLEKKYQDLYRVLKRRFEGIESFYINGSSHSGNVSSPVAGKEIGIHQWKQIITNKKLIGKRRTRWKETEEGFTESSLQTFAESFRYMVRTNPIETIEMVLNNQEDVLPVFADSVYIGVADSECIDMIQMETWERLFMEIPYNRTRDREICFCRIIENVKNDQWSDWILNQLIYLSVLEKETTQVICRRTEKKDLETLKTLVLNTVRGRALKAMGHLLWSRKDLLDRFRDTIDRAVTDSEAFIRMAAFEALWPAYNIDRDWAEVRILSIYESDVRMAGQYDSKGMFFRLYPKYRERVLQVIRKCLNTEEKELLQIGMYTVCEFYIQYNEFEDILVHLEDYSEEHWRALLHMAVLYLENENWREKGKKVILRCKQLYMDIEYPVREIFDKGRIDLKRDSDFLIEIMQSNIGRRTVYSFVRYLEKSACSLKDYAEIIIALCENMLTEELKENPKQWGIANDLSKLIIALYDETANSVLEKNKQIAERCLELWDIMFEKQIGQVRNLSRELMER